MLKRLLSTSLLKKLKKAPFVNLRLDFRTMLCSGSGLLSVIFTDTLMPFHILLNDSEKLFVDLSLCF